MEPMIQVINTHNADTLTKPMLIYNFPTTKTWIMQTISTKKLMCNMMSHTFVTIDKSFHKPRLVPQWQNVCPGIINRPYPRLPFQHYGSENSYTIL